MKFEGAHMGDAGTCGVYEQIAGAGIAGGFVRPGGAALTERALSLCAFSPGSRLLDVGCGAGAALEHLTGRHGFFAAGIDLSFAMLAHGRARNPVLPLIRAAAESLPFGDGEWDGVLAECSLSVTVDPDAALRECLRVLRRGGKLILSDIYLKKTGAVSGLRGLSSDCCLTRALPQDELLGKLANAGFAVPVWEDHSAALKHFAAQLIFSGETGVPLWRSLTGAGPTARVEVGQAVRLAGFGYFLAVAHKPASTRGL
jgi:SAM-dependent methyltransferase